ncbi:MAG: hypothetical protein JWP16_817 [Alphaproteobacteria bacterium]|jgi:hypothetical protein|nr:hypothetical protein [Alphaproteobacteria bacterium]MDB5739777.1 hypothetical protein [Alphaproteobacteria bacterium]
MRACFLGQGVTALGFGVATLQAPPLVMDEETGKPLLDHEDRRPRACDPAPADCKESPAPLVGIRPL